MPPSQSKVQIAPLACSMLRKPAASGQAIQQVVVRTNGAVSAPRLARAWEECVASMEVLRCGFDFSSGSPELIERVVRSPMEVCTEEVDLEAWLQDDRRRPLDLAASVPWRCHYLEREQVWVWTVHHALLDGRSLTAITKAFLTEVETPGSIREHPTKVWQEPDPSARAAACRYFKDLARQIDDLRPEFPGDEHHPSRVSRVMGASILRLITERAEELEVTPASVVTWAWGQAVALTCGASTVAIGQVRSGRPQPGRMGFSMNTLPVVIPRERAGTESLGEVHAQLRGLRAFENFASDQLAELGWELADGPWPGGVVMVERGTFAHQVQPPEWVESIEMLEESGEPLLASAYLSPQLQLEVEFDGRSVGKQGASLLLRIWSEILVRFATVPEQPPVQLPEGILLQSAALESSEPSVGHEHLAVAWQRAARTYSDRTAVQTEDLKITYAELDQRVEHLAARLEISGIVAGSIVASELKDRAFFPTVLLACARIGAIHLPLDPDLPLERRRAMVSDAAPAIILTDLPVEGGRHGLRTMSLDHQASSQVVSLRPEDPRSPLTLLYTSGSTGKPKGVIMTHGGVCNEAHAIAREAGLAPGEKLLQFASPGFDASLEEVLSTLLAGATLMPRPEKLKADFLALQDYIEAHAISVLDLSTAHWAAWCAWMKFEGRSIPTSIKTTIIGGERATGSAVEDWFDCGGRSHLLLNTYGPTEASVVASVERIDRSWNGSGDPTIGRPLPGVHVRIGDAEGNPIPPGAAGELWIGGDCIGPGYWQDPERTKEAFHQREGLSWYRTRDRACWEPTGHLRFLGRVDDQLKIRGNRIEPAEVSRELENYPGISAAHVGPVQGPDGNLALAAWIRWATPPTERWPAKLREHCRARLPAASIPTRWAEVSEFKLTERGKIDHRSLPDPNLTASSHLNDEAPETPTEIQLAEIWKKLLGLSFISRDESFFELGGDSINALRMFAEVFRQFGRRMPVSTLIETPSLRGLAAILEQGGSPDPGRPQLQTISEGNTELPLICLHGGDGGVVFYRRAARAISTDRRIFAIESPLLSIDGSLPERSVEEIAQSYLEEILKDQPSGPFRLLGYSFGGLLAYEVARLLLDRGKEVAFLGLVDTLNPTVPTPAYDLLERATRCWETSPDPSFHGRLLRLASRASEGLATHLKVRSEERELLRATESEPFSPLRALQVRAVHERAGRAFEPKPVETTLHLFRAGVPSDKHFIPDDYGWSRLVPRLVARNAKGSHLTMFDDENFPHLATLLSSALSPAAH